MLRFDIIELLDYLQVETLAHVIRDIELELEYDTFYRDGHKEGLEEVLTILWFAYYLINNSNEDDDSGFDLLLKVYNNDYRKMYDRDLPKPEGQLYGPKHTRRSELYKIFFDLFWGEGEVQKKLQHKAKQLQRKATLADVCRELLKALREDNHNK